MAKGKVSKPLVRPFVTSSKKSAEAARLGKAVIEGKYEAYVSYRRRKWCIAELLQHLARRVYDLERNQCKPSVKCLFKGQEYIDDKYTTQYNPPILPIE